MTTFEKRLVAAEAKAEVGEGPLFRLFIEPRDHPDIKAWRRECEAEAERDRVERVFFVRFVRPGNIAPPGPLH